jgi:hypothetical protein
MVNGNDLLGRPGEQFAAEYPEQAGLQVIGRAHGSLGGELRESAIGWPGQRDGGFGTGPGGGLG